MVARAASWSVRNCRTVRWCTTCRAARMRIPLLQQRLRSAEGPKHLSQKKAPQCGAFSFPRQDLVMHRRQRGRVQVRDGARVLEGADALDALLAADARGLHAAERRTQVQAGGAVVIVPDVAA